MATHQHHGRPASPFSSTSSSGQSDSRETPGPTAPRSEASLLSDEGKDAPPIRLWPSNHHVTMTKFATSTDSRGFIPVYEYPVNGYTIMIDTETGMVHFTGIWKALGHNKADVVRLIESQPEIAGSVRKVRGGYLKIQGTWLPFEIAQTLAKRCAWNLRFDLVPLFGPTFPDSCLAPGQPGFGQLLLSSPKSRARRYPKNTEARAAAQAAAAKAQNNSSVVTSSQAGTKPLLTPPAGHSGPSRKGSTGYYGTSLKGSGGTYGGGLSRSSSTGANYQPHAGIPTPNARYSPYGSFYSTPSIQPSSYPPASPGTFFPYQPTTRASYPPPSTYSSFHPPQASAQAAAGLMSLNSAPQQSAYSSIRTNYGGNNSDPPPSDAGFTFAPLPNSRPQSWHSHDLPPQLYHRTSLDASTSFQATGMTRAYSQTPSDDGGAQDWQTYRTRQALTLAPLSSFNESSLRGSGEERTWESPVEYRSTSQLARSGGEFDYQPSYRSSLDIYPVPPSYDPPFQPTPAPQMERQLSHPFPPSFDSDTGSPFQYSHSSSASPAPTEMAYGPQKEATTVMSRSFFRALEAKTEFVYAPRRTGVGEKEEEGRE